MKIKAFLKLPFSKSLFSKFQLLKTRSGRISSLQERLGGRSVSAERLLAKQKKQKVETAGGRAVKKVERWRWWEGERVAVFNPLDFLDEMD